MDVTYYHKYGNMPTLLNKHHWLYVALCTTVTHVCYCYCLLVWLLIVFLVASFLKIIIN